MSADAFIAGDWGTSNSRFMLCDAERKPHMPRGRKARAIVGYLANHLDEHVSRHRLIELFWPERATSQARGSLRQSLLEIRRLVEQLRVMLSCSFCRHPLHLSEMLSDLVVLANDGVQRPTSLDPGLHRCRLEGFELARLKRSGDLLLQRRRRYGRKGKGVRK